VIVLLHPGRSAKIVEKRSVREPFENDEREKEGRWTDFFLFPVTGAMRSKSALGALWLILTGFESCSRRRCCFKLEKKKAKDEKLTSQDPSWTSLL